MGRVSLLNVDEIRGDFPIFSRQVGGRPLIYLDSAATSQRPRQVVEAVRRYYEEYNSNVHRGVYSISVEATEEYERARRKISRFINAKSEREVVFVRGTTEALNLVAYAWALRKLRKGDKILLTEMEHHSNIVPWQLIAQHTGAEINYIPFNRYDGKLELDKLDRYKDFKILSFTYASNVLGTINDAKRLVKYAHENNALAVIDAAQAVPHMRVDVQEIGCDFLAFSGHKMLGPTGIGVLYGRRELLEEMQPFMGGGEMIREVHLSHSTWNEVPWKFEAGTPNVAGAIGLGAAVDYLERIGMERIREHEESLTKHALDEFEKIKGMRIYGPLEAGERAGLIAFNVADIHAHDLATLLDEDGICVRAGHHCAMPIHTKLETPATTRASFYLYNTHEEIERLTESIKKAAKKFKIT
ncbi:MAG TPA: cysteine desulfurase [Candidatus Caldiarchaeum subterraneum]|uniref:Cysteine desulfurase n=1 Tax=Caldiarchaeum subterraneum TaxID=311458 RepID=A0A833EA76_CALS0|nr:cysteine desulfurase [Aigarchaeota archaeon]HIQ29984.1 cysteine desulfurase [Candidatus Caldarchaeum subterraneum]